MPFDFPDSAETQWPHRSCVLQQDHTNPRLREALTKWLNWLKDDIGFEGWRFDFAKGYGAEYVAEYCQGTVGTSVLNVGEFWTDAK